jgi:hypothetical protein
MNYANRGEWSESYALARLLDDGRLNMANEDLSKVHTNGYEITRITTSADSPDLKQVFQIKNSDDIILVDTLTGEESLIKRRSVREIISKFFDEIVKGETGKRAFLSPNGNELKELLRLKRISATSLHKPDLLIEAYDPRIQRLVEAGYSIKSQIGAKPTLFNASQSTNLIYRIKGITADEAKQINLLASCRKRIIRIYELGGKLIFESTENKTFESNLRLVDSNFLNMLAESLIIYYSTEYRNVVDVVKCLNKSQDDAQYSDENYTFLIHNFKKFLFCAALGMVSSKPWDGLLTTLGGIIMVKRNGEVLGYNPSDINLFQLYLLNNSKFDSPDSKRTRYGKIYTNNGNNYVKLNFQIRYTH